MTQTEIDDFQAVVWAYYDGSGRHDLPWRQPGADGSFDAYRIVVSELMLQQTQVSRVLPKYAEFLERFPTVSELAAASLSEVLIVWQGLGYNRRAKYLWQTASMVVSEYGGVFPQTESQLTSLPGIGVNTAGAVMAYANNQPAIFVETNIRTVYIHHFFNDQTSISDKEIIQLVGETLPKAAARIWYWALMDYGVHLKQTVGNKSRASKSYVKQSPFQGSRRQVRGTIIRQLGIEPARYEVLKALISDSRLDEVLGDLEREGMLCNEAGMYRLA